MTERRLEKCLDSYYTTINKSLDKACPKKAPKTKDKNNPWRTKQLTEHRRIVNRLYKRRLHNEECMQEYKQEEKEYRKACLKAKQTDWKQGVEKQSSLESINKLRKILEFNNKQTLGILLKEDGSYTEPGQDTLDYLLKTHFPAITDTQPTEYTELQIATHYL